MMEKIKSHGLKILVLLVNLGLVAGGTAYIKNQQDKKKSAELEEMNAEAQLSEQQISDKTQELDQVVQNNADQKNESIANNLSKATVQQPKTITTVAPKVAATVKATKPASTKTTKKS